jgi:predicted Ser/Thr protein kinase
MIGQLVGHYKVVRKIGDGGMGSVFEAVHETIGRRVAVKVLKSQFSKDKNVVTRFFNEARAVNIVSHPGVVGSFDYGEMPDGTAYIVMEYLEGESLSSRIKRTAGPFGFDALRIGRQIGAALAAAHTKGIIHRDLKPDNVIIVPDSEAPGGERAKVLDFGIAKITDDQQTKGLTQMGEVMGTPRYMSPEQCKGSGQVDAKTDVYALGIIMFIMLTGKPPFDAEGTGALMAMHIYHEPPKLREIEPKVPPKVEELVLQMLLKKADERPSMADVVARLGQLGGQSLATGAMPILRLQDIQQAQQMMAQQGGQMQSGGYPMMQMQAAMMQGGYPGMQQGMHGQQGMHHGYPQGQQGHSGPHGGQVINPAPAEAPGPNTSSRPSLLGVGQTHDPTKMGGARSGVKRLLIPVTMATVLSVIGIVFVLRTGNGDPPPARVTKPAAPKQVVWEIKTDPPGVQIIRTSDDSVLGQTPWRSEQSPVGGKVGVILRLAGYQDKTVVLERDQDFNQEIKLEAVPPVPTKPVKVKKPKKKKEEVDEFAPVK